MNTNNEFLSVSEINKIAKERIALGHSKKEIFSDICKKYKNSKYEVAAIISSYAEKKLQNKYKTKIKILLGLLGLTLILKVLYIAFILINGQFNLILSAFLILIAPLVNIWLLIEITKQKQQAYVFTLVFASISISSALGEAVTLIDWIGVVSILAIMFLSFDLCKKLFPERNWSGLKTDKEGNYLWDA